MGPRVRGDDESIFQWQLRTPLTPCNNIKGTIVLAGAGKMGGAMLSGWLAQGLDATPPRV